MRSFDVILSLRTIAPLIYSIGLVYARKKQKVPVINHDRLRSVDHTQRLNTHTHTHTQNALTPNKNV